MRISSVKYSSGAENFARHYHDAHQIMYIAEGKIVVNIGQEEYTVGAGSLLIFSRFEEHSIRSLTPVYRRYTVRVSSDPDPIGSDNYILTSVLVNRSQGFCHVVDTGEQRDEFESLFRKMAEEFGGDNLMREEALGLLFRELLLRLYRHAPRLFASEFNRNIHLVQEVQKRLEERFSEEATLASLAAEQHISPSYLAHLFKSVTGYAPIEYLMSCRLSAAKKLLGSTEKGIGEIVELCGYGDESNFSRMFKAKTGMTPSGFRRQYREPKK